VKKLEMKNVQLLALIRSLKKTAREKDAEIWNTIADSLAKPRSTRIVVNLSRINRHAQKGQTIAIAGKVLGSGTIDHPITVAAFAFSPTAEKKIKKAKGKCLTLAELMEKNAKGSNVKIVG
jgi:large subunit ribosomal protein L18e